MCNLRNINTVWFSSASTIGSSTPSDAAAPPVLEAGSAEIDRASMFEISLSLGSQEAAQAATPANGTMAFAPPAPLETAPVLPSIETPSFEIPAAPEGAPAITAPSFVTPPVETAPAAARSDLPPVLDAPPTPEVLPVVGEASVLDVPADGLDIQRFGGDTTPSSPGLAFESPAAAVPPDDAAPAAEGEAGLSEVSTMLTRAQDLFRTGDRAGASAALLEAARSYDEIERFESAASIYRSLSQTSAVSLELMTRWLRNCRMNAPTRLSEYLENGLASAIR